MTPTDMLPLLLFALVTAGTPGPNNVMLMASGARFGLRRTLPHIAGINLGVVSLVVAAGLGLAEALAALPALGLLLKVLATLWILRLAWAVATAPAPAAPEAAAPAFAGPETTAPAAARPMTPLEAAAFQWINPKAWAMALTALGVHAPAPDWAGIGAAAAAFLLVGPPANLAWTAAGGALARALAAPGRRRAFNGAMAVLLVLSMVPALAG